jgi:hypothetical protein
MDHSQGFLGGIMTNAEKIENVEELVRKFAELEKLASELRARLNESCAWLKKMDGMLQTAIDHLQGIALRGDEVSQAMAKECLTILKKDYRMFQHENENDAQES